MARNATPATQRQLDAIETASRRAGFTDPQHAVDAADVYSRNWRYDLSRPDATAVLDALTAGLAPKQVTVTIAEAGMSAGDAVALFGQTVTITFTGKDGGSHERTMVVESVKMSNVDSSPAIAGSLASDRRKATEMRLSKITGWGA